LTDGFAAKTKPTIHGADADELEQHAVGATMHNAFYRRVREVADRVGAFFFAAVEFGYIRDELPRDWIRCVVRIDEVATA
jgi:hypothetical protein